MESMADKAEAVPLTIKIRDRPTVACRVVVAE